MALPSVACQELKPTFFGCEAHRRFECSVPFKMASSAIHPKLAMEIDPFCAPMTTLLYLLVSQTVHLKPVLFTTLLSTASWVLTRGFGKSRQKNYSPLLDLLVSSSERWKSWVTQKPRNPRTDSLKRLLLMDQLHGVLGGVLLPPRAGLRDFGGPNFHVFHEMLTWKAKPLVDFEGGLPLNVGGSSL